MISIKFFIRMLLGCFFLIPLLSAELTKEERLKIEKAVPAKASVQPKKTRRLLVTNFVNIKKNPGYGHTSIPHGNLALQLMGKATGAYEMVINNDTLMFRKENLQQFDAVCFNNTTGVLFTDPELRKNLLEFIKSGKGFIGFHAAGATMCQYPKYDIWPEFGEMLGGFEDGGHPWTHEETTKIKLDDPDHPLNAVFQGKGFKIKDEAFQFRHGYSREKLHILLAIDADDADFQRRRILPERMKDRDLAISWIRNYEKGRVFYSSLGHNPATFYNPAILQHFLDGIQFALGDYEVDATPSLKPRTIENILDEIKTYEYGDSRLPLTHLSDLIRHTLDSPQKLTKIEEQMLLFLQSQATLPAKEQVCRELRIIGSEKAVPILGTLLTDTTTSGMALYALEGMPYDTVDDVLLDALQTAEDRSKTGIINTLGHRRCKKAVRELSSLVPDPDQDIAMAAISALGNIGGTKSAAILKYSLKKTNDSLQQAILDAILKCADRFAAGGDSKSAESIYTQLYGINKPVPIRAAALRGLVSVDNKHGSDMVTDALRGDDPILRSQAIALTREIPGDDITKVLMKTLSDLSVADHYMVLAALADRGDISALPAIIEASNHEQEAVRNAALNALGKLGDSSVVLLLAERAASAKGAEKKAARENSYRLRGGEVNQKILDNLNTGHPDIRVELIRSTGMRKINNASMHLLKTASDPDVSVRAESFKSLAILAGPKDLPELVDLLIQIENENGRSEVIRTVGIVANKIPVKEDRSDLIIEIYNSVDNQKDQLSLLLILINLGNKKSIPIIQKALYKNSMRVNPGILSALSDQWPQADAEIMTELYNVAGSSDDIIQQNKALRGYIRLVGVDNDLSVQEKIVMYQKAIDIAHTKGLKGEEMILSGLGRTPCYDALKMAAAYLDEKRLQPEAESAIMAMAPETLKTHPDETKMVLEKILNSTDDDYRRKQIERFLQE
jgi:type 1 glutamine amidotransferase/HEAT repeat protein